MGLGGLRKEGPQALKPKSFCGLHCTTEQLGEKARNLGGILENIPRRLKPGVDFVALAARINPCPFKTFGAEEFFTKL
jgi:hypothetical protein